MATDGSEDMLASTTKPDIETDEVTLLSPVDDGGSQSDTGSGSGSGSGSESETEPVLALTRERRANAGSRMAQLLKLAGDEDAALAVHAATEGEEGEDGYADIFQEAADDREFEEGRDDDADVDMSSSSEDDDGAQDGDEEAGERELMKEKMLGRGKKRKKMSLLQQTMRLKKLKYAPVLQQSSDTDASKPNDTASPVTAPVPAASRPKKKVERVTWLPDVAGTRSSMRKATVHNKQATHKRLKEHEKKRKQTLAQMQASEDRRKAKEAPPMTQEERLARAAEIERINLTTVNSWEAIEQQRQEERNAKLAALKNRKLEGPVITFWSGPAIWVNGKLQHVGKRRPVEEVGEEVEKEEVILKLEDDVIADVTTASGVTAVENASEDLTMSVDPPPPPDGAEDQTSRTDLNPMTEKTEPASMEVDKPTTSAVKTEIVQPQQNGQEGFLDGIEYWASMPDASPIAAGPDQLPLEPPQTEHDPLAMLLEPIAAVQSEPLTMPSAAPTVLPLQYSRLWQNDGSQNDGEENADLLNALPAMDIDTEPAIEELAARSLITLTSFTKLDHRSRRYEHSHNADDENGTATAGGRWGGARVSAAEKDRELLLRTLFSIPPDISNLSIEETPPTAPKTSRSSNINQGYDPLIPASAHPRHNARYLSKRAQHCAITGQVARYRDPSTGLPYASAAAYKSVRKVLSGQGAWSSLLQCWIGEVKPAKGVPESVWFGTETATEAAQDGKTQEGADPDTQMVDAAADGGQDRTITV